MPIYMDRHDVSDEVTASHVAQLHKEDLKIQHKFDCRGLTYWFDGQRKTAFCLVEAPNKEAIKNMHDHAHGQLPHRIIKVDDTIVESFLGRIEDPEKSKKTKLNIINEPAFRTIMFISFKRINLKKQYLNTFNPFIIKIINSFYGRIVKQELHSFLVSFSSVSDAVNCAMDISSEFNKEDFTNIKFNIGLSAGVPVTEKDNIFEDTIIKSKRLCNTVEGLIVMSSEVKDLYESEHQNKKINTGLVNTLSTSDEIFLNNLMDYTDKIWHKSDLKVDDYSQYLGISKSQLYRKIKSLTGVSPNTLINKYRLNKALDLLKNGNKNISEIAFQTGFNSPGYFTKCFLENFGILPSHFLNSLKSSN